jgi:hypothetical protein
MAMTTAKGGRPATGAIKWQRNAKTGGMQWHAQVTLADKSRPWVPIDPSIRPEDEERARSCALETAQWFRDNPNVESTVVETVSEYVNLEWLKDRAARVNSIRDDVARMRLHILPTLGGRDIRTFTRDHVEEVRDELDRKILSGEIGWKTAASSCALVTTLCDDLVNAKKKTFRRRTDNPCTGVRPPERGKKRQKQYLYPSEFLQFVSCEKVPLRWRRAVAIAVFTYTRDAELRVLRWQDIKTAS